MPLWWQICKKLMFRNLQYLFETNSYQEISRDLLSPDSCYIVFSDFNKLQWVVVA